VFITAPNGDIMQKAKDWVLGIVEKPEVGKVYDAKVTRIIDGTGAIVEFGHGKDAMIHISELQWARTEKVEDILKVGQEVKVKCIEFDAQEGKTRLSLKQMTEPPAGWVPPPPRGSFGGRGGPPRHGGGGFRGGPRR
jgi:polyribonucleotide nucleotidyltransferase